MKKLTVVTLLLLFFNYANAQIFIGPTAGFGHSFISHQHEIKFHASWNAGVSFEDKISSNFCVGVEVKYSVEGYRYKFQTIGPADGPITVINKVNSGYIRLPVKFIYFFEHSKHIITPKIYVGPDFGFLVNQNHNKYYQPPNPSLKNFDLGGIAALGLNWKITPATFLSTEIAYYDGLTDASKADSKNLNRNVQLNVGLFMSLKNK